MPKFTAGLFLCAALAAAAATAIAQPAPGPSGLRVVERIPGPDGSWDYASFEPVGRRVYIAHETAVTMVDTATGQLNPAFAQGKHLHAVIPAPGTGLLVLTDSGDSTVRLINSDTGKVEATIPVGSDPDGAVYDPATRVVVVVNGEPGDLTLIDVASRKVVGVIHIGDALEYAAVDGKGRLFVNLEEKNGVAVVDLKTRKVTARYDLPGCKRPTGLAYVAGDRLISACGNHVAKILDASSGRDIATLPVGGFPDAVIYDAGRELAFIPAALDGTLAVVALAGSQANTVIDSVPTQVGGRTGTVDPTTGRIYIPTAEYVMPAAPGGRPTTKPGTFAVLVLDRR